MSPKKNPKNLLDLRPVRLLEHRLEEDRVTVLIPKYRSRWMGWLQSRLSRPYFLLHLDPVGTAVWLDCDGNRTVSDIGKRLKDKFGEDVEPLWDRLALFFRQMRKGRLIELRD